MPFNTTSSKIVVHPQYDPAIFAHDFCLIKLTDPAPQSDTVRYATLATSYPPAGTKAIVTGWGYTNGTDDTSLATNLQSAELTVIDQATCARYWLPLGDPIHNYQLCTQNKDKSFCSYGGTNTQNMSSTTSTKVIKHPHYDKKTADHDFCLVKLVKPVELSDTVMVIPMASSYPSNETIAIAMGWGRTDGNNEKSTSPVLLEAELNILDRDTCVEKYKFGGDRPIHNDQICTNTMGKSICQGDSGGPLTVMNGTIRELVGVVSFVQTGCPKIGRELGHKAIIKYGGTNLDNMPFSTTWSGVAIHPLYNNPKEYAYDFCLIKMVDPVKTLSDQVQYAKLATDYPPNGTKAFVSGWGKTDGKDEKSTANELQHAQLTIINLEECEKDWSDIGSDQICTKSIDTGTCNGDSGGPLTIESSREVVGVVSYGERFCPFGVPIVYGYIPA
ncbi:unnamed protein product, partial [Oppiella nova]